MTDAGQTLPIAPEQAAQLRRLSHELSNALEIILQTSYLIGMLELDENGRQWRAMLDQGVAQATKINRELREYVRANS